MCLEATMFSEIGYIAFLLLALPYIESGKCLSLSKHLRFVAHKQKATCYRPFSTVTTVYFHVSLYVNTWMAKEYLKKKQVRTES